MTAPLSFDAFLSRVEEACLRSVTKFLEENPLAPRLSKLRVSLDPDEVAIRAPERHVLFMMMEYLTCDEDLNREVGSAWSELRSALPKLLRDIRIDLDIEAFVGRGSRSYYKINDKRVFFNLLETRQPEAALEGMRRLEPLFPSWDGPLKGWMILRRGTERLEDTGEVVFAETHEQAVFLYCALRFSGEKLEALLDREQEEQCADLAALMFIPQPLWTAADIVSMTHEEVMALT